MHRQRSRLEASISPREIARTDVQADNQEISKFREGLSVPIQWASKLESRYSQIVIALLQHFCWFTRLERSRQRFAHYNRRMSNTFWYYAQLRFDQKLFRSNINVCIAHDFALKSWRSKNGARLVYDFAWNDARSGWLEFPASGPNDCRLWSAHEKASRRLCAS